MQDYFEFANAFMGVSKENNEKCDSDYEICAPSLAMAYVPLQKYREIFSAEEGYCKGTIFKELYKPFKGCKE